MAIDAARQDLAKCEQFQAALAGHIAAHDQAMKDNEPSSPDHESKVLAVAELHTYLDRLQKRTTFLRQHVPAAQMKTEAARTALSRARLAEKAVTTIVSRRAQHRRDEEERRTQHALDDVARNLRRP